MMRIKVVTSINVRSSPSASPRVVIQEAAPEPERGDAILEKSSSMPSLAPIQHSRMHGFLSSQRIPRGSRLSGWLHGSSVWGNDSRRPPIHDRETSHTSTYCFAAAGRGHHHHAPGIRSYPSTRGLIDPVVQSPTYGPSQLTHGSDPRHGAYLERLRAELGSVPRDHGNKRVHCHHKGCERQRSKRAPAKNKHLCFPQIQDMKMRQKIVGCLFFGTLLTIVLTTCESFHPLPHFILFSIRETTCESSTKNPQTSPSQCPNPSAAPPFMGCSSFSSSSLPSYSATI